MLDPEIISIVSGAASSAVFIGIYHGVMKAKVEQLERIMEKKVDANVYEATMKPVIDDLRELKQDLKELLKALRHMQYIRAHEPPNTD